MKHYLREVRNYLDNSFPGRWISRRGPMEWPACSPGLTTLGFLCGYLKQKMYETEFASILDITQE